MGIFGMIGKMAGSKVVETVENELTKKQNREQTKSYCNYINNNLAHVCKLIADLDGESKASIDIVASKKGAKLSFKEKGEFRKTKEKAEKNLQYLYLTRDFFTVLAKNASGLILKNEELMLVTKFAPFFDGVPVLDIDEDDDSDDSLMGAFKEVGQELKEAFISAKKNPNHFDFDEYMSRYDEKIENYTMPDIDSAIESFKSAMATQEPSVNTMGVVPPVIPVQSTPTATVQASSEEIECPSCHTKLNANAKFCLECGQKIEIKKPAFCTECGEPIVLGAKFCSGCGAKIV